MEMSNQGSVLVASSYLVDNDEQLDEKWFPLISSASYHLISSWKLRRLFPIRGQQGLVLQLLGAI